MLVSFFVRGCDYFLLCPGGGYSLWWPIRGGSTRNPGEVLNKYFYGEAPPRGPTPYPSRKRSIFVTDSYFMTVRFQQLKGIQSSKQGMWKEYHRRYTKSWKMVYKRLRVGPPPCKNFLSTPPLPSPPPSPLPGCYVTITLGPAHKCCFKGFEFSRIVRSSDLSFTR